MMGRRRGRPSVIGSAARTAGRTAVIVGTANAVTQKQASGAGASVPQPTPPVDSAPAGMTMDQKLEQLKKLGELRDAGILSDAEFELKKHAVLSG
ncbi:MAG: SHOCT domain-containing protein [Thermaurantiacus sp.]